MMLNIASILDDASMPTLALALDPQQAKKRIVRRLLGIPRGEGRVEEIRVVRHKPGRRCVIEYEITGGRRLIGKIRAGHAAGPAFRLAQAFWKSGFDDRSKDGVSIPEPVGEIRKFRMWVQRRIDGKACTELLEGPEGAHWARRIAEAAFKIHRAGIPPSRTHSMRDELRILAERLPSLWASSLFSEERIQRVLRECRRVGEGLAEPAWCGIHRDFYPDQVLVSSDRIYLIDFDLYCLGDPALDIGNFLGHVAEHSLRTLGDPGALDSVRHALRERYLELAGESHRGAIEVYETLTLARLASLSTVFPERRPWTRSLLEHVEERLKRHAADY